MVESNQFVDSNTAKLLYDRAALMRKIKHCKKNLDNVHWTFLEGLLAVSFGLFLIWLVIADVTLLTIGTTSLTADPISFQLWGSLITFIGLAFVVASVYIKIRYPSRLRNLKQSLNELDDLLHYQLTFPRDYRENLARKFHVHYDDYLKEWKKTKSVVNAQNFMTSYGFPLCIVFGGLYTIVQSFSAGHVFEATIVGAPCALIGIAWLLFSFNRRTR